MLSRSSFLKCSVLLLLSGQSWSFLPQAVVPQRNQAQSQQQQAPFFPALINNMNPSTNNNKKPSTQFNFIDEARKGMAEVITNLKDITASRRLRDYQRESIPIASSFVPQQYNPHPALTNHHFQTILGVYVRDDPGCAYIDPNAKNIFEELMPVAKAVGKAITTILSGIPFEKENSFWDTRERFRTNDGDFFDVDYKFANDGVTDIMDSDSEGLVLIVHGLESNSNSSLSVNMARAFRENNMDVACINFRGCSGQPNDTILQYHAGFTDDIMQFLNQMRDRGVSSKKPLYMSGFSLGSNVIMKCVGDLGVDAVDKFNIRGMAVSGAPFTLMAHWRELIDNSFNRIVYAGNIMKTMKKKVDYLTDRFFEGDKDTSFFDYWKCINAETIADIEDGMIAPMYGFEDKFDYYRQTASLDVVERIAVPTYVLNAADDPFFTRHFFPWEQDCDRGGVAPLKLMRTEKGGHLGHLFHRPNSEESEEGTTKTQPTSSFMPMELARFIKHVHKRGNVHVNENGKEKKNMFAETPLISWG